MIRWVGKQGIRGELVQMGIMRLGASNEFWRPGIDKLFNYKGSNVGIYQYI